MKTIATIQNEGKNIREIIQIRKTLKVLKLIIGHETIQTVPHNNFSGVPFWSNDLITFRQ